MTGKDRAGGEGPDAEVERDWVSLSKRLTVGAVSGAVAKTAVAPAERCKILMQVAFNSGEGQQTRTAWGTVTRVWVEDGLLGFWRGNGAVVVRIAPYAAIQFASFEWYNRLLSSRVFVDHPNSPYRRFLCGGLAGLTSVAATYPLDLIRTRLTVQRPGAAPYRGIWDAFCQILGNHGLGGLYHGARTTLVGIIPYAGINFCAYGAFKADFRRRECMKRHPVGSSLLAGSLAGLLAQTATYPLDVVRRRIQVVPFLGQGPGTPLTSGANSISSNIVHIVRREGARGLYRGLTLNYIKTVPAIALSFTVYEHLSSRWGLRPSQYSATAA